MVETETLEEATAERLKEIDVVLAIGIGDANAPKVLIGRQQFVRSSKNPAIAEETRTLRVKLANEEELAELIERVKEAKGKLDDGVE